jgi:hypothetical protein
MSADRFVAWMGKPRFDGWAMLAAFLGAMFGAFMWQVGP